MFKLPENQALRAGLYMVLAMGSFVTNDTLIKVVGQSLPVGEIIMVRGFMAFLLIGAISCSRARCPRHHSSVVARGVRTQ